MTFYAVENDLIGGWAVSEYDKPLSQHDHEKGEHEIADFTTEIWAKRFAECLNNEDIENEPKL